MRAVRRDEELVLEAGGTGGPEIHPHFIVGALADVICPLQLNDRLALGDIEAHEQRRAVGGDVRECLFSHRACPLNVPSQRDLGRARPRGDIGHRIQRRAHGQIHDRNFRKRTSGLRLHESLGRYDSDSRGAESNARVHSVAAPLLDFRTHPSSTNAAAGFLSYRGRAIHILVRRIRAHIASSPT